MCAPAPQSGGLSSLIVDGVDTDVFELFLDEMAKAIPKREGVRQVREQSCLIPASALAGYSKRR